MSQIFQQLQVGLDEDLGEKLELLAPNHSSFRILRKSVDARRATYPHWVYSVEVFAHGEAPPPNALEVERIALAPSSDRPLVVGSGPAGLFAALRLVERGVPCTLLERGSEGGKRIAAINRFWRYGELDVENNVCFGEGGAGLYSDGKLITRIKSPHIPYVIDRLVRFGAPEEIRYLANPHVGSDRIRRVIPKLRRHLQENGCDFLFDTRMTGLLTDASGVAGVRCADGRTFRSRQVILATGHSAEDVIDTLRAAGVAIEGKSFALGLRIEHPQASINKIQFRRHADHPALGAANYRLAHHDAESGIGVYSFCMCPGGYVLSSGTSADGVVSNGMSNYHRNSPFASAAVVVSVDHESRFGAGDVFGGLDFRRRLERRAASMVRESGGTREIPVQRAVDFLDGRSGPALKTSSPSGARAVRLDQLLPADLVERLRAGLAEFDRSMKGFLSVDAQFHGIESRTSCPIRVTRNPATLESISHPGLYPAGEGAGYAGGITSAACDGVRIADQVASVLAGQAVSPVGSGP